MFSSFRCVILKDKYGISNFFFVYFFNTHILEKHVEQLANLSDTQLNVSLSVLLDVETLYCLAHGDVDSETKQIYFYLYKTLKKFVGQNSQPFLDNPLGVPPFEQPSIVQIVRNFASSK